jgi:hypothetical protein
LALCPHHPEKSSDAPKQIDGVGSDEVRGTGDPWECG